VLGVLGDEKVVLLKCAQDVLGVLGDGTLLICAQDVLSELGVPDSVADISTAFISADFRGACEGFGSKGICNPGKAPLQQFNWRPPVLPIEP
jgi:hypothetical protein